MSSKPENKPDYRQAVSIAQRRLDGEDWDGVVALLSEFLPTRPDDPQFYEMLANALRALGRISGARQVLTTAADACPTSELHILQGKLHRDEGEHGAAIDCYDRAIALDPRCDAAYCQKGLVLERVGKPEQAQAAFDAALNFDPGNGMYWLCAAKADYARGADDAGDAKLERARHALSARRAPNFHYNMACIEAISGNLNASLDHFESFLKAHPFAFGWADQDEDLENIRPHPRMHALRKKYSPAQAQKD